MATTPPWKRRNPKQQHTKLTEASKRLARARAQRAGRAYPNLVDNMYAAKLQAQGGEASLHQSPGKASRSRTARASTAKKSTARKSTAKKSTARKTSARTSTARRSATRHSTTRKRITKRSSS